MCLLNNFEALANQQIFLFEIKSILYESIWSLYKKKKRLTNKKEGTEMNPNTS